MRAMLPEKKADLIPGVLPFSLDPSSQDRTAASSFTERRDRGDADDRAGAVRKPFIDKNRAAMVDFMEDTLRIVRWYLDPANQRRPRRNRAKITKQPPERFGWLFTKQDYYRDPDLLPNLEALQKNLDMTQKLGFIKQPIDIQKYTDLSLVKEAMARLGKK